jgi:hypothetical protein
MRKSEQYGLNWRDVDLQARRATLRETKNGTVRHVPLNTIASEAFRTIARRSGRRGKVLGRRKDRIQLLRTANGGKRSSRKPSSTTSTGMIAGTTSPQKRLWSAWSLERFSSCSAIKLCRWCVGTHICRSLTNWLRWRSCVIRSDRKTRAIQKNQNSLFKMRRKVKLTSRA